MNDEQLLRYSRQILLKEVGYEGQERLLQARVLIIGLGGLGSPVAMYLAAAGIGQLVLVDFDEVEISNLQRQVVHGTADIGRPKVESARDTLQALNPDIAVSVINKKLDQAALAEAVAGSDVVVDCSDNFSTRFMINQACADAGRPLVSGAAIRMEGQVTVFHHERPDSPCYRCLYREIEDQPETCSNNGVLAPLVGIIGSVQATETIKVLLGLDGTLGGRLLLLDAVDMEWRSMQLRRDPACPVCAGHTVSAMNVSL
jgi:adenylyltransferase/sulfurtransferase